MSDYPRIFPRMLIRGPPQLSSEVKRYAMRNGAWMPSCTLYEDALESDVDPVAELFSTRVKCQQRATSEQEPSSPEELDLSPPSGTGSSRVSSEGDSGSVAPLGFGDGTAASSLRSRLATPPRKGARADPQPPPPPNLLATTPQPSMLAVAPSSSHAGSLQLW